MTLLSVVPSGPAKPAPRAIRRAVASAAPRPLTIATRLPSACSQQSWRDLLGDDLGQPASERLEERFASAPLGIIPAGHYLDLRDMVIVADGRDILIESDEGDDPEEPGGRILTAMRGRDNHCRIIFRRSYHSATCESESSGSTVHLFALSWHRHAFQEDRVLDFHPRDSRSSRLGEFSHTRVTSTVTLRAQDPLELHGVAWRGGRLRLRSLTLDPKATPHGLWP